MNAATTTAAPRATARALTHRTPAVARHRGCRSARCRRQRSAAASSPPSTSPYDRYTVPPSRSPRGRGDRDRQPVLPTATASSATPTPATPANSPSADTPTHTAPGNSTAYGAARRASGLVTQCPRRHEDRRRGRRPDRDHQQPGRAASAEADPVEHHEDQERAGRVGPDVRRPEPRLAGSTAEVRMCAANSRSSTGSAGARARRAGTRRSR